MSQEEGDEANLIIQWAIAKMDKSLSSTWNFGEEAYRL